LVCRLAEAAALIRLPLWTRLLPEFSRTILEPGLGLGLELLRTELLLWLWLGAELLLWLWLRTKLLGLYRRPTRGRARLALFVRWATRGNHSRRQKRQCQHRKYFVASHIYPPHFRQDAWSSAKSTSPCRL
jgi:hypothetical protein